MIIVALIGFMVIAEALNQTKYFQVTNLPLISIHLKNESESVKDSDSDCSVTLINNGKIEIDEKAEIKLRGDHQIWLQIKSHTV